MRISKPLPLLLVGVAALAIGIGLLSNCAHTENVHFKDGFNTLSAYYETPDADKPTKGVVIFVHGDGAMPYDGYGYYDPIWNIMLRAGYAVFSWDKPGVGRSKGNWLHQSMTDRQKEVLSAISFLKNKYGYRKGQIGLMGFSQAGWVVPAVARNNDDIGFVIGVGFAMNWMDQGWYLTRKRMEENGDASDEIEKAYHQHLAEFEFLKTNPSYSQYQERYRYTKNLKPEDHDHLMSEDRFVFVKKNYLSNATDDYQGIKQPILILLGEKDLNVNIQNTQNSLRRIFSTQTNLTVHIIPEATHGLLRYPQFNTQNPGFGSLLRLLWEGENAYADGFLNKLGSWLDSQHLPAVRSIVLSPLPGDKR